MPVCVKDPWEAEDGGSWTLDGGIAQAANNRGRMVAPMKRLVLANDAREILSDVIVQKIISEERERKKPLNAPNELLLRQKRFHSDSAFFAIRYSHVFVRRNKSSQNQVRQRQHDVEIAEMSFVVHVMVRI